MNQKIASLIQIILNKFRIPAQPNSPAGTARMDTEQFVYNHKRPATREEWEKMVREGRAFRINPDDFFK